MLRVRRQELVPRLEMTPMIDVIFLLLTFFIYSLAMMISTQVLPVQLTTIAAGSGGGAAQPGTPQVQAITIDQAGAIYFNREALDLAALEHRLRELAGRPEPPIVYLAMEAQGQTDRGPLLLHVIDRVRGAGISRFVIVGQKPPAPGTAMMSGSLPP